MKLGALVSCMAVGGLIAAPAVACADDLAKSWGLDPTKLKTEKSPVIPRNGGFNWLPPDTIPFADSFKLSSGANQVRLMVDATGKPTACAIHQAVLDKTTNDKICKILMAKASFTPAKDADGQPMPGFFVTSPLMLGPPYIVTTNRRR